jgi:predicted NBD/HSP70 family sugar kinase
MRHYHEKTEQRKRKAPVADSFDNLLELAEHGNPLATEAISEMAHHLGVGMAMLVTGLAPDLIVVVGEVTRLWEHVGPIINREIQRRSFTHAATRVIASGPAPLPRLRGIIAFVLQKRFETTQSI